MDIYHKSRVSIEKEKIDKIDARTRREQCTQINVGEIVKNF